MYMIDFSLLKPFVKIIIDIKLLKLFIESYEPFTHLQPMVTSYVTVAQCQIRKLALQLYCQLDYRPYSVF